MKGTGGRGFNVNSPSRWISTGTWRGIEPRVWGLVAGAVALVLVVWSLFVVSESISDAAFSVWLWLRGADSNATTLRNVGLGVGGPLAVSIAWWRSSVSQRTLLNERYQKGAEMLGNGMMAVRLGGIYALGELAREHPKTYHVQVLKLFCAYARASIPSRQIGDGDDEKKRQMVLARQDIQEIMDWIGKRRRRQQRMESAGLLNLVQADLSGIILAPGANLAGALLAEANLSRSSFSGSDLAGALLYGATLANAFLDGTNLSDADLRGADLCGASLKGARMSGAKLSGAQLVDTDLSGTAFSNVAGRNPAKGLARAQLDEATTRRATPPRLDNVVDDDGQLLTWRTAEDGAESAQ